MIKSYQTASRKNTDAGLLLEHSTEDTLYNPRTVIAENQVAMKRIPAFQTIFYRRTLFAYWNSTNSITEARKASTKSEFHTSTNGEASVLKTRHSNGLHMYLARNGRGGAQRDCVAETKL